VQTKKDAIPNIKWLDFVKTNTAKRKIKAYFEKKKKINLS
jgi:(p)ppGpp synthase/HD superfamily hydrolase